MLWPEGGNIALPERFHTGRFGRFVRFGPNGREMQIMKDQIPAEPDEEDAKLQDYLDELEAEACEREAAQMRRAEENFGY